jgi:hypothetical protein
MLDPRTGRVPHGVGDTAGGNYHACIAPFLELTSDSLFLLLVLHQQQQGLNVHTCRLNSQPILPPPPPLTPQAQPLQQTHSSSCLLTLSRLRLQHHHPLPFTHLPRLDLAILPRLPPPLPALQAPLLQLLQTRPTKSSSSKTPPFEPLSTLSPPTLTTFKRDSTPLSSPPLPPFLPSDH